MGFANLDQQKNTKVQVSKSAHFHWTKITFFLLFKTNNLSVTLVIFITTCSLTCTNLLT